MNDIRRAVATVRSEIDKLGPGAPIRDDLQHVVSVIFRLEDLLKQAAKAIEPVPGWLSFVSLDIVAYAGDDEDFVDKHNEFMQYVEKAIRAALGEECES